MLICLYYWCCFSVALLAITTPASSTATALTIIVTNNATKESSFITGASAVSAADDYIGNTQSRRLRSARRGEINNNNNSNRSLREILSSNIKDGANSGDGPRIRSMTGRASNNNNSHNRNNRRLQRRRKLKPKSNIFKEDDEDDETEYIQGLERYIINGEDVSIYPDAPERYPYHAVLIRDGNGGYYCGGTLIAPDIVLTAGHCSVPKQVEIGRVTRTHNRGNYERRTVAYSYRHPRFDNRNFDYDAQLLKLTEPSSKTPVKLNDDPAVPREEWGGYSGATVTVTGFGLTSYGGTPSLTLREVDLTSITNQVCEMSSDPTSPSWDYQMGYKGRIRSSMMCLADRTNSGKDGCTGDSGGPAILRGAGPYNQDVQVGITSWAYGCALPSFPGVYSRISDMIVWLRSSACAVSDYLPGYDNDFNCDRFPVSSSSIGDSGFRKGYGGPPLMEIKIVIEFGQYPDRISWSFLNGITSETLVYKPTMGYANASPWSYSEEIILLPSGNSFAFFIQSAGANGIQQLSVTYEDYDGNTVRILDANGGGGDGEADSATVWFDLPTAPPVSPTKSPSASPTKNPTQTPTHGPTHNPTNQPTKSPTSVPTSGPTHSPTHQPTHSPTHAPTPSPTHAPTRRPTSSPTISTAPSIAPTPAPTASPTAPPTETPTTAAPTKSHEPSTSRVPSESPSLTPSLSPSSRPSPPPSGPPSASPSLPPSADPIPSPSRIPSETSRSGNPSLQPTPFVASSRSSILVSPVPTASSSKSPTKPPTFTPSPPTTSTNPSGLPSNFPSKHTSVSPSNGSVVPVVSSSADILAENTTSGSLSTSTNPSGFPSNFPSKHTSVSPSNGSDDMLDDESKMDPTTTSTSSRTGSSATTSASVAGSTPQLPNLITSGSISADGKYLSSSVEGELISSSSSGDAPVFYCGSPLIALTVLSWIMTIISIA